MAPSAASANLCTSTACIQLAGEIMQSMATNYTDIDPCEDFEQYACGNWAIHNPIPDGQDRIYGSSVTKEPTELSAKRILEGLYPTGEDAGYITVNLTKEQAKADKKNLAKLQDAYQVCTDHAALKEEGLGGLSEVVETIIDMFPANGTKGSSTALIKTLTWFESVGIESLQRLFVFKNDADPDIVEVQLSPPTFKNDITPTTDEEEDELMDITSQLLEAVYPSKINSKATTDSIYEFRGKIKTAYALITGESTKNVGDLRKIAPSLNYDQVAKGLAPKNWSTTSPVIYKGANYFKNISEVVFETSTQTLQAFFVWRAVTSLSFYVEHDLTNAYNDLRTRVSGNDPESLGPRWKTCLDLVNLGVEWIRKSAFADYAPPQGLTWILARFFVDKHFSPEQSKLTSDMVDYIKDSFGERIETRDWATSKVKKAALEKLDAMEKRSGLPTDPDAMDPIAIEEYYSDIEIKSSLVHNALAFAKSTISRQWKGLGKPFSREQFFESPLESNAFHVPFFNQIHLTPGFMQAPNFDMEYPSYINYGAAGCVAGHEITHGFDSRGYEFDKTGKLTSWWDKESLKAFKNKTKCFIEQYSNATVKSPNGNGTDIHINGTLTLAENIADAGGIVSSFAAWKKWESDKGKAKNLPGLDRFTHEQLFFLKFAQTFCSNIKPKTALNMLSGSDNHALAPVRAMLPMQNSAEFNKAFKCPKKKPVCELW